MKGSIVRGVSLTDLNGRTIENAISGPKRIEGAANCQRCGCKLSQYRDPEDNFCCSCQRALNPMFKYSA